MASYLDKVGLKNILNLLKTYIDKLAIHISPDWGDNDVNSKSYIKNRTHYVEILDHAYDSISWYRSSITTLVFHVENYTEDGRELLKLTSYVKVIDGESTVEKTFHPILFDTPNENGVSKPLSEYPQIRVNVETPLNNLLYLYKIDTVNQILAYRIISGEDEYLTRFVNIVNNQVSIILPSTIAFNYTTGLEFLEYTDVYHKLDKKYIPNEVMVPDGGNAGDVLTKKSEASGDLKWESPVQFQTFMLLDFGQTVNKTLPPLLDPNSEAVNIDVTVPVQYQEEWALASLSKYECLGNNGEKILINIGASFSMNGQKTLRLKAFAIGSSSAYVKTIQGALMLIKRNSFTH